MSDSGIVYLVGAGPGDPGLITVKGLRCLEQADVIVYDRLCNPALLIHAKPGAEKIFMGKEPGTPGEFQAVINSTLVESALSGKMVVRLKGGDPFVFGRGGEELLALKAAHVPFKVVPGITSAIAVPEYAGIPVTHRGTAASFTVVTGSEDPSKVEIDTDWGALAATPGTLIVLMGWRSLPSIISALIENGRPASTPVAITQWGTTPQQRTISGTLANIVEHGKQAGITSPVVTIIGEVAKLSEKLRWYDDGPLFGTNILVTRARSQASSLVRRLEESGSQVIEVPAIEIAPLEDYSEMDSVLARIQDYDWLVFTSVNGVRAVFDRLGKQQVNNVKIAAVGPATAAALKNYGAAVDLLPSTYTTDAISTEFKKFDMVDNSVLLARADIAPDLLPNALKKLGAKVEQVTAYRTIIPEEAGKNIRAILESDTIDVVTFTSSSTVRNFIGLLNGETRSLEGITIASIGPVTTETAVALGLKVDVEAKEHTIPGLVQSLISHFKDCKIEAQK